MKQIDTQKSSIAKPGVPYLVWVMTCSSQVKNLQLKSWPAAPVQRRR